MEKRNVIEDGRTPELSKQAAEDAAEQLAAKLFDKTGDTPPPAQKDDVTHVS